MQEYILLMVGAALVNNVILARFLGLCSFMGVTTRIDTAIGMGLATTFVITVSSMGNWAVEQYLLEPYHLGYLRTVTFILVIAGAVQFANDSAQSLAALVSNAGDLLAADYHQLRSIGRGAAVGRRQDDVHCRHRVRFRLFARLQLGNGDFCWTARAAGAG